MDPFQRSDERDVLVRLPQGAKTLAVRFLFSSAIGIVTSDGPCKHMLVMPYWDRQQIAAARKKGMRVLYARGSLTFVLYRDIYWLYRSLIHGDEWYSKEKAGEISRLYGAIEVARTLHAVVLQERADNIETLRKKIDELCGMLSTYLHPCIRDDRKEGARDQLQYVRTARDSRGRVNQSAHGARVVGMRNLLTTREQDIGSVKNVYASRRQIVSRVISYLDFQVNAGFDFLDALFLRRNDALADSVSCKVTAEHLRRMAHDFEPLTILPFSATFGYAKDEFLSAACALDEHRTSDALSILQATKSGFMLRKLRADLERDVLAVSRKKHWPGHVIDSGAIVSSIRNKSSAIRSLDTSNLKAFDSETAVLFLDQASGYLASWDFDSAHQALLQASALL